MNVDRVAIRFLRWLLLAVCLAPALLQAQQASPTQTQDVLIKNAVVMTVTHGNIKNGSIYVKDGKIAAVGENRIGAGRGNGGRCGREICDAGDHRFAFAHCA